MKAESTIQEFQKGQALRIWDMVYIAPLLIYAGSVKSGLSPFIRTSLVISGVATFIYNANNYFKNEQLLKDYNSSINPK